MKRLLSILLSIMLGLLIPTSVYAETTEEDIDLLLSPYLKVINQINQDLGSNIYIPVGNEEMVYNNIKNLSLYEFEVRSRSEYADFCNSSKVISNTDKVEIQKSPFGINSISIDVRQTHDIQYDSQMYLDSEVFSVTGADGTFQYQNIWGAGSTWDSDFTGYHFETSSVTYSLSNNDKNCTVSLRGYPLNAAGMALGVVLRASHTFNAG